MSRLARTIRAFLGAVRPGQRAKALRKPARVRLSLERLEEWITPDGGTDWLNLAAQERVAAAAAATVGAQILHLENAAYDYLQAESWYLSNTGSIPSSIPVSLNDTYNLLSPLLIGTNPLALSTAVQVAGNIAALQLPNGAMRYTASPAGYDQDVNARPYYLTDAYFTGTALYWALGTATPGTDLLAVTKGWLTWCLAQADSNGMLTRNYYYADGTTANGPANDGSGTLVPSIPPDAQDSNSAMILAVLAKYVSLGGDTTFLATSAMKAKIELITKVMQDLQQPNGLTWGSAGYPISDTEDNAEVFLGFRGAAYIETTLFNDATQAGVYTAAANRVQQAIQNLLFNSSTGLYDWALNTPSDLSKSWYPDTITQVWPILYGVIPANSARAQSLLAKVHAAWTNQSHPHLDWQQRVDGSSVALAQWLGGNTLSAETALLTTDQNPAVLNDGYPLYVTTIADAGFKLALLDLIATDRATNPSSSAPPSALSFADNFNRTDAGDLGTNWTIRSGTFATSLDSIYATAGTATATANGTAQLNAVTQATVSLPPAGDASAALTARYSSGSGDGTQYTGGLVRTNGVVTATITRYVNGTPTVLAQSATVPAAAQYQLRFEAVNDSLKLFVNGALAAYAFDTTIATAGAVGIRLSSGGRLDDFADDTAALLPVSLPAPPATTATDTFTLADGSQLGRSWRDRLGNVSVSAGRAVAVGATDLSTFNVPDTINAGARMDVAFTATGQSGGIVLRYAGAPSAPDQNFYWGMLRNLGGGQQSAEIWVNAGGTWTNLFTATVSGTGGALRFEANGTALKLFLNNARLATVYDATLTAAGGVGVRGTAGAAVDNFTAFSTSATAALPFSDPFTANGTTNQLSANWTERAGALTTVANTVQGVAAGANVATVNGVGSADVAVSAVIGAQAGALTGTGLVARYQANGDFYLASLNVFSATQYQATIRKSVGGVLTTLFADPVPITAATAVGQTLRFEVFGSSLKMYLNNVLRAYVIDTAITGAGTVGVRMGAGAVLDEFSAAARTGAALPFTDSFDANGTTNQLGSFWSPQAGTFTLGNSNAQALSAGANVATVNGVGSADVAVSAVIGAQAGALTGTGLVARYQANGDFYLASLNVFSATQYQATIRKSVGGVLTTLFTDPVPITAATAVGQTLRFEVFGSSLKMYLNDVLRAFVADTSIASAGTVGVRMGQGAVLDDFAAAARAPANATLTYNDNFNTTNAQGTLATTWQDRAGFVTATAGIPRAVGGASGSPNVATLNGVNAADVTIAADLFFTAAGQSAQLVARYSGTGDDNFYFAAFDVQANGDVGVRIAKKVNGTVTNLATATLVGYFPAANFSPATPPRLRFTVFGNALSLWVDGTRRLNTTDSTFATGSVGIRVSGGTAVDNFSATTP